MKLSFAAFFVSLLSYLALRENKTGSLMVFKPAAIVISFSIQTYKYT